MTLFRYKALIQNLPYLDQAFETKRSNWQREYVGNDFFRLLCDRVFIEERLKLSRADLFSSANNGISEELLILIVFWGYPRNMRGNTFSTMLSSMQIISHALKSSEGLQLDNEAFSSLLSRLTKTGVGLSTLTKFLYFLGFTLNGYRCLILDQRIIDVIQEKTFIEFSALAEISTYNKTKLYTHYLAKMEEIANAENYSIDQLEFFLFQFGKNLKVTGANT